MSALKVNENNFESVKNSDGVVLLDFYADWCGPCKMLLPVVDELADELAASSRAVTVAKVNVDENAELARAFGIVSIPTLVVMKEGKVVKQASGARPKAQILSMLEC